MYQPDVSSQKCWNIYIYIRSSLTDLKKRRTEPTLNQRSLASCEEKLGTAIQVLWQIISQPKYVYIYVYNQQ